jgi:hypothetical protein
MECMADGWAHRHPILAGIIASVVAAAIAGAGAQLLGLIDLLAWSRAIGRVLVSSSAWLSATTPVSNWLHSLIWLGLIAWLVVVGAIVIALIKGKLAPNSAGAQPYTEDEFFIMKWRWNWGGNGRPENVVPFCRTCDMQLIPSGDRPGFASFDTLAFDCPLCRERQYDEEGTTFDYVRQQVILLIQRKLRNRASGATHTD